MRNPALHASPARRVALVAAGLALTAAALAASASKPKMTRVSVDSAGEEVDSDSYFPAISGTGRYVVFESAGATFVPGDDNGARDVFRHDRKSGETICLSLSPAGVVGDDPSQEGDISANGRFVVFSADATTLVEADLGGNPDIFCRDVKTGETTLVSVDDAGVQGDADSRNPSISANGRLVAFQSRATNLVEGDLNTKRDIFVRDRKKGTTTLVSVSSEGVQADGDSEEPALSGNGRFVAFASVATTLVAGDRNAKEDIFVHDRKTGETTRMTVSPGAIAEADGDSNVPALSASGRYVAYLSRATNLAAGADENDSDDVFLSDRKTGVTDRISLDAEGGDADDSSFNTALSASGRYVVFESSASDLVAGDTGGFADIFVADRKTGEVTLVTLDDADVQADSHSEYPDVSRSGRFVTFSSGAANLVAADQNGDYDVFVRDRK